MPDLLKFTLPRLPGPWIIWLLILVTRYGFLKLFSPAAAGEADEVPVFSSLDAGAHRVHMVSSLGLLAMSVFLEFRLDTPAGYIGIILLTAGWLLYTLSFYNFSRREPGKPAVGGLFAVSRHPVHLSFLLTQYGICLATLSLPYTLVTAAYHVASEIMVRAEEIECRRRYGDDYGAYEKRVRRYIGRKPL